MPIPSIPIEIVGEIAFHLRTPLKSDTHEAIKAGRALSLVCHRCYPIGQALRWRDLRIDIASVPSLLTHFEFYPHLPHLIISLDQSNLNISETQNEEERQGYQSLPKLLSTLQNLRSLVLRPLDSTLETAFRAAANLQHLVSVNIHPKGRLTWSKITETIFAQGFPSIREFSLLSTDLVTIGGGTSTAVVSNHKNLRCLSLTWSGSAISNSVRLILANMDLTALQSLVLGGVPAWTSPFELLAECTSLKFLRVYDSPQFFPSTFPTLIANLSKASSLMILQYQVPGGGADDPSYSSPITIDEFFASVPPNLRIVQLKQVVFAYCDSVQDQSLALIRSEDKACVVQGLIATSEGVRCVQFWTERGAEEKKGYRCIFEYPSWADFEARNTKAA